MNVELIVAHDKNRGIGKDGDMPWPKLKEDFKWLNKHTKDKVIIMGRSTWDSLPVKPLKNRINIVISNKDKMSSKKQPDHILKLDYHTNFGPASGATDFLNKVHEFYPNKTICIFGGQSIYNIFAHKVSKFYVTEIDEEFECDTWLQSPKAYIEACNKINYLSSHEEHGIKYTIKEYINERSIERSNNV